LRAAITDEAPGGSPGEMLGPTLSTLTFVATCVSAAIGPTTLVALPVGPAYGVAAGGVATGGVATGGVATGAGHGPTSEEATCVVYGEVGRLMPSAVSSVPFEWGASQHCPHEEVSQHELCERLLNQQWMRSNSDAGRHVSQTGPQAVVQVPPQTLPQGPQLLLHWPSGIEVTPPGLGAT
jgi:hypothetical protein